MSKSYSARRDSEADNDSGDGAPQRRYHGSSHLRLAKCLERQGGEPGGSGVIVDVLT